MIGGFVFLVAIIDLFSRKVVGWSLGDRLDADLSGEALRRALARRTPPPGRIFHSDRGSEFAARSFRDLLSQAGALQSMSRKGDCWDNAVAESFWRSSDGPSDANPFAGSGTTGVAAIRLGRRFLGWELNAEYVVIARKRLAAAREQLELGL